MPKTNLIIAIDGPAGSGKSTLARELAHELKYLYVDTGAMYRAITWKALKNKIDLSETDKLQALAAKTNLALKQTQEQIQVFVDGEDVTEEIRAPLISNNVSIVAKIKGVRECMVKHQRRIGEKGGVVLEGRDIGTVVFPQADVKFYVEAQLKERAQRRQLELKEKGVDLPIEKIEEDLKRRDSIDQTRQHSPLKPATDAIVIDSTLLSIEEKTQMALTYVEKALKQS